MDGVERTPIEVVRTYVGPTFVVRERLFAPREQAGAIISYEVERCPEVRIEVALGGRSVGWDAARSGYVEREPLHDLSGTIASVEAVAYDDPVNYAGNPAERLQRSLSEGQGAVLYITAPAKRSSGQASPLPIPRTCDAVQPAPRRRPLQAIF